MQSDPAKITTLFLVYSTARRIYTPASFAMSSDKDYEAHFQPQTVYLTSEATSSTRWQRIALLNPRPTSVPVNLVILLTTADSEGDGTEDFLLIKSSIPLRFIIVSRTWPTHVFVSNLFTPGNLAENKRYMDSPITWTFMGWHISNGLVRLLRFGFRHQDQ